MSLQQRECLRTNKYYGGGERDLHFDVRLANFDTLSFLIEHNLGASGNKHKHIPLKEMAFRSVTLRLPITTQFA